MITKDIGIAINELNKNEIIAIPTETVYGLAGNAYNELALKRIFDLKKRPYYNPLIVHIKSIDFLNQVAKNIPSLAIKLAEVFWPGPLTLLLDKQSIIPDLVTSGKNTVAIRVPNHSLTLELLNALPYPLAAPSANPFGSISPTRAEHVEEYFKEELPIILNGGECARGIESTIIGFENGRPILYRHGSITIEEIETVVGKVRLFVNAKKNPEAPGMLSKHYAPATTLHLAEDVNKLLSLFPNKKTGLLLFKEKKIDEIYFYQEILSENGDLNEAASKLYEALYRLDKKKLDLIIAEKFPDKGLGKTINDRLERASKK